MVSASITSTLAAGLGTAGLLVIGWETAQPAAASTKHRCYGSTDLWLDTSKEKTKFN